MAEIDPFGYPVDTSDQQRIFVTLADAQALFRADQLTNGRLAVTFEELRNRAVFQLIGEGDDTLALNEDDTLPNITPKSGDILGGQHKVIEDRAVGLQKVIQDLIESDTWTLAPSEP